MKASKFDLLQLIACPKSNVPNTVWRKGGPGTARAGHLDGLAKIEPATALLYRWKLALVLAISKVSPISQQTAQPSRDGTHGLYAICWGLPERLIEPVADRRKLGPLPALIGITGCLALAVGLLGMADVRLVNGAHMSGTLPAAERGADAGGQNAGGNIALSDTEAMVRSKYGRVVHLSVAQFAAMGDGGADVLLLDVRELEEFQVSRIEGAERVDPGVWTSTFLNTYGKRAAGKHVVLYCSVGVRSSKLAARVQDELRTAGVLSVSNLEGGIFRWHNEQRRLLDDNGETQLVHKYDTQWGRLVERQSHAVLEYRQ